jgi:hypothetical protein
MELDWLMELIKFSLVGFFSGIGSSAGSYITQKTLVAKIENLTKMIDERNKEGRKYPEIEREVLNLKKPLNKAKPLSKEKL